MALFGFAALGPARPDLYVLVFLISPVVAAATFMAVSDQREVEPLRARWGLVFRACGGLLVLFSLAGIVGSTGRLIDSATEGIHNGPLAMLFLAALILAWRALTRPSPRRAALPACVVHIAWIPMLILNVFGNHREVFAEAWMHVLTVGALLGILAVSAFVALLALVGFDGASRLAPARATERT